MADTKISGLTAGSALAGPEMLEMVQSAGSFRTTVSAIYTYVRSLFPDPPSGQYLRNGSAWQRTFVSSGYVSGNWYPADYGLSLGVGGTMSANLIYFSPLVIYQDITITALMAEVTANIAASNFQLAIYAMDPITKLPVGAALTSTASMSGATATQVSSTLGSPLFLSSGQYWVGVNTDTASIGLRALANAQSWAASYSGSATMSHVISASPGRLYYTLAQTFGTWPTVVTVTEAISNVFSFVTGYKAQ